MSKLCVVPQEPTEKMIGNGASYDQIPDIYRAMLAARPPLPADIEAAVELANDCVTRYRGNQYEDRIAEVVLARALLKACGRE